MRRVTLVFFGATTAVYLLGRKKFGWSAGPISFNRKKLLHRFRRPWPFCFAVLSIAIFAGAILYPPSNHTALSYRTPRVLHWLAEGHWYWIHTPDYRMNNRACGIEWLSAPLLLFTRSDRLIPVAQLFAVPAFARADIQRLHTTGSEGQGGLELDVAVTDGLQFPASGRERRQRHVSNGLCSCSGGLRVSRVEFTAAGRALDVRTCCGAAGRRQSKQPAAAFAMGFDWCCRCCRW